MTGDHRVGAVGSLRSRPAARRPGTAGREADLVGLAIGGDRDAFERLVLPYRRELHVHCYRMLGSLHDAEDLVQDTLLRAWRSLDTLEQRGSLRAWLYRIATNACLNQLRRRPRVVVPAAYRASGTGAAPLTAEVPWLEPYPDRLLAPAERETDPAEQATRRLTTSLALLTAVQVLSPRQRAVLILRDVLGFSGAEVAAQLETSPTAVDSALRRARRRLPVEVRDAPTDAAPTPRIDDERLVRRFVAAWERADVDGLVALLARDAVLAVPPTPAWFRGRSAIGEFLASIPAGGHLEQIPLLPTHANGQPAVAAYMPDPDTGRHRAYGIMVLTIHGGAISGITGFADPGLFPSFALPEVVDHQPS